MTITAKYSRPILSRIFDLLACIALIGAGLSAVAFFMDSKAGLATGMSGVAAVVCLVSGIIYIGIGQAIDYLAQSAFNTARTSDVLEKIALGIAEIARQTAVQVKPTVTGDDQDAKKYRDKVLTFLERIDSQQEHGHALLKWLGEVIGKSSKAAGGKV